jgi:beta-glucosidase
VETNRTDAWARHVDFIARTFGDLVGGWKPVNETNYYATLAYRGGGWPPGRRDPAQAAIAHEAIHLATAEAAVRLRQTGAPVASIFGLSPIVALDTTDETATFAGRVDDHLWRPGIELFRDGVLRVETRPPIERPDLAGAFDLFGFSYYSAMGVANGRVVPHPADAPRSPLGYAIWADGLGLVLQRLHVELPRTPLVVAEYGIGTADDEQRTAYLARGLEIVGEAIGRGVEVRGFFHWTGVDNYEWLHGFDVQFGILDGDRNVRPSAAVLRRASTGR